MVRSSSSESEVVLVLSGRQLSSESVARSREVLDLAVQKERKRSGGQKDRKTESRQGKGGFEHNGVLFLS